MFFVAAGIVGTLTMAVACILGLTRDQGWSSYTAIWQSADVITLFLVGLVANALAFMGRRPAFTRGPGIFIVAILAAATFAMIWHLDGEIRTFAFLLSPAAVGMSLAGMGASYFVYSIKRRSNPEAGTAGFFYSLSGIIIIVTYFSAMFQYGAHLSLGWTYLLPGTIFACIFYVRVFSKESSKPKPRPRRTRA